MKKREKRFANKTVDFYVFYKWLCENIDKDGVLRDVWIMNNMIRGMPENLILMRATREKRERKLVDKSYILGIECENVYVVENCFMSNKYYKKHIVEKKCKR